MLLQPAPKVEHPRPDVVLLQDALVALIDVDGTVADNRHRAHYMEGGQRDWDSFNRPELVLRDGVVPGAPEGVRYLRETLGFRLVFLTGRMESLREATARWLVYRLGLPVMPRLVGDYPSPRDARAMLVMREEGDQRPAGVVKAEIAGKLLGSVRLSCVGDAGVVPGVVAFDDDARARAAYQGLRLAAYEAPGAWQTFWHHDFPWQRPRGR